MRAGGYRPYYAAIERELMSGLKPYDDAVLQFDPGSHPVEVVQCVGERATFRGIGGRRISVDLSQLAGSIPSVKEGSRVRIYVEWSDGVRWFRNATGDVVVLSRQGEVLGTHPTPAAANEQMRRQGLRKAQLIVTRVESL